MSVKTTQLRALCAALGLAGMHLAAAQTASGEQTPSKANLHYRGIGNPQEAEYVLSLQDGIPIVSDWIGVPTLYYLPVPQSVAAIQLVRGGANLLYGP